MAGHLIRSHGARPGSCFSNAARLSSAPFSITSVEIPLLENRAVLLQGVQKCVTGKERGGHAQWMAKVGVTQG
jgi:hypothetical protein